MQCYYFPFSQASSNVDKPTSQIDDTHMEVNISSSFHFLYYLMAINAQYLASNTTWQMCDNYLQSENFQATVQI